ncbi:lysylphosphatidylglycerol synthase transmembrane domain-containing protein [Halosimplex pelagicum]|uniref:Flippase-like domain-containing protein n=1 Tax=Halosimplex pelagicum TaxID=869886 RepID=A0A7D5TA59_9EURY|nr:flippase-like domain-containing protein [Halosimplex pelagicum]QLH81089.1 flippase-like domain-containing protein [Halosimplex pelagicum]
MNGDRWATVVGFVGAALVLAALVWVVGIGDILSELRGVELQYLLVILGVAVVWLFFWGLALRTVLGALDAPLSVAMSGFVFAGAVFSNNVTPFGQAGGEPVSGYLISRATDSEYETGLAAIASVDALHFVPSIGYAMVGLTFVVAGAAEFGRNLVFATTALVALAVGIPAAAYFGWQYRYELEAAVVRAVTPIIRFLGRVVPRKSAPTAEAIERRIEGFFGAIERVATSRTTMLKAVGFSALGWLAMCTSLWLSVYALGHTIPFSAVLLVVPMGAVAGMTPLPGGLGGVDAVLIALLVSTTGVSGGVAGAAVLVHRGATYVFPTVVGGGVAFALGVGD